MNHLSSRRRGGRNSVRTRTAAAASPIPRHEIKLDNFCIIDDDIFYTKNRKQKYKTSRSCFVAPETQDFSSLADDGEAADRRVDQLYDEMFEALFGPYSAKIPTIVNQQEDVKSEMFARSSWVDTASQLNYVEVSTCTSQWNMDKKLIEQQCNTTPPPTNITFSEKPRVKVIAEKFYKFKKNHIELRQLEEKVVCIEYDVFHEDGTDEPRHKMRAYFSVRPKNKNGVEDDVTKDQINHIKRKLELPEDGSTPTKNQIEMIDGQISQNQSYLDDLKIVLQQHKAKEQQKKKSYLDLKSLYEIARNQQNVDSGICEEQLKKAKELILKKCNLGVHGVTRRMVSPSRKSKVCEPNSAVTKNILNVMLSELGEI